MTAALTVDLGAEVLEQIAQRAAEMLADTPPPAEDGWLRGAERIAAYLDCPPSRVYALSSARRIPVEHESSALVARKSDLDQWIRTGGGKRP